ncbi:hypothetical protein [Streptomyces sp. NPDC127190]
MSARDTGVAEKTRELVVEDDRGIAEALTPATAVAGTGSVAAP